MVNSEKGQNIGVGSPEGLDSFVTEGNFGKMDMLSPGEVDMMNPDGVDMVEIVGRFGEVGIDVN